MYILCCLATKSREGPKLRGVGGCSDKIILLTVGVDNCSRPHYRGKAAFHHTSHAAVPLSLYTQVCVLFLAGIV